MTRLSVVIPTFQRRDCVRRALEALARQTLPAGDFEVIVAIDGSDDGTREMVESFAATHRLRSIWQANRGRAAACNAGIRSACGEVVVLLDDDMEPEPGFLAAHLDAHQPGARLGVLGAVPVAVEPDAAPVARYVAEKFNAHLERLARPGHQIALREFYSGNFSIRREVLREVGLFDEAFRIYGNEDVELSIRLAAADVRLAYSPEALARQRYTKDFGGLARDTTAKGRTAVLLAEIHAETLPVLRGRAAEVGSRRWHFARAWLLGLGAVWPGLPAATIRLTLLLERRRPAWLHRYYQLVLDLLFWSGVRAALRENRRGGRALTSLARPPEPAR